jgi:DNA-binding CsgD family transcriptional regulator
MIFDLILFCAGMLVIFLMKLFAQDKTKLLEKTASSALIAGSLVTVIKLLVLVSSFEHMELPATEIPLPQFLIKIFVNLRPLFFGIFVRLILMPFEKRSMPADAKAPAPLSQTAGLLSRRELEVAKLAAKGWTNTQIADQLFISVATVKRHLATVFEKLNINSRRELGKAIQES